MTIWNNNILDDQCESKTVVSSENYSSGPHGHFMFYTIVFWLTLMFSKETGHENVAQKAHSKLKIGKYYVVALGCQKQFWIWHRPVISTIETTLTFSGFKLGVRLDSDTVALSWSHICFEQRAASMALGVFGCVYTWVYTAREDAGSVWVCPCPLICSLFGSLASIWTKVDITTKEPCYAPSSTKLDSFWANWCCVHQ